MATEPAGPRASPKGRRAWRTAALILLLGVGLAACASKRHALPPPDGVGESSPPSLQGRIASVEPGQIVVTQDRWSSEAGSDTVVRLTDATEIFTVYGGYVRASKLVPGLKVRVWCAGTATPNPGEAVTATIVMIASKDPNDEWP